MRAQGLPTVSQLSIANAHPGRRGPPWDENLFESKLQTAVVHHNVKKLRDMRLQHERGDPCTADALWVHDTISAGATQLLFALLDAGPSDDEQIWAQGTSAEGDEQVRCVAIERRDKRAGATQPSRFQYPIFCGVADHGRQRCLRRRAWNHDR